MANQRHISALSAVELEEVLAKDKVQLVDVREVSEYEQGRIEGAILIPLAELSSRLQELEPDVRTVVYCHSGFRSNRAAKFLVAQGFSHVENLTGGIEAWLAMSKHPE